MNRKVNLKGMSVKSAFQLAIAQSNKTQEEIMDKMGWTPSITSRFFSFDGYLPTYSSIPKLCHILGNTVLVDWLVENLDPAEKVKEPINSRELLVSVVELAEKYGNLAEEAKKAAEDNDISQSDAKKILKKVRILSQELSDFYIKLDPILYEEEG